MTDDPHTHRELEALGAAARRAVAAAEAEALALGHDRVGTEHLLLGVLADQGGGAAWLLGEAGARAPLVRRKVLEALPARPRAATGGDAGLALSPRATRALGRSLRFARRADMVTPEHLLLGVLDVEGTAGQVLRSLGVDLERLRAALAAGALRAPAPDPAPIAAGDEPAAKPLLCPSCGAAVAEDLTYRVVRARGEHGPRDAGVYSCGMCGSVLGVVPS